MGDQLPCGVQKYLHPDRAKTLRQTPLFRAMLPYIRAGEIFPALRKNQVDFYADGARLFSFSTGFRTNGAYVADGLRRRDVSIGSTSTSNDASELLATVRARAAAHREKKDDHAASELKAVHELIGHFSPYADRAAGRDGPLLIDLEARFASADPYRPGSDMIDLVFLTPCSRLLFVEAKRQSDTRCRSASVAEVERVQVERYRSCVRRSGLAETYASVLTTMNSLFAAKLGSAGALSVWNDVPILILNPDAYEEKQSSPEQWLRKALERAPLPLNERLAKHQHSDVIDGRADAPAAIRRYVSEMQSFPAGLPVAA